MRRGEAELLRPARYSVLLLTLAAAALAVSGAGCAARGYRVEGMVIEVRRGEPSMMVSHRAIPGRMPAMTMPFPVARVTDLDGVAPGARISFQVRKGVARSVRISTPGNDDFDLPPLPEKLAPGATVPDFALPDHRGGTTALSSLRGRLVLINFIYTRCPLAEVCPRLSASFAALQRRFRERIPADLVLLSITLDPQYDTAPVLARYAGSLRADAEGWRFLTGDTTPVARRFGLVHWPEEGVIVHNSNTALIDRQGRLAALVEGSAYRLEQLADLVRHHLEAKQ